MNKVFIIGLGLMGASYALKLSDTGHLVYGYDIDDAINKQAIKDKVIIDSDLSLLKEADLVIMCLYPHDIINFIKNNASLFKKGQLITDISGTKEHLIKELSNNLPEGVRYLSHHPMAGRESKGYYNKDVTMFLNANFLIVETNNYIPEDVKTLTDLAITLGFKNIQILSPVKHDELIGLTSQLTHLLAVSLMLTDNNEETKYATGDSFRDLTRIAKINESLWTELFLENKTSLSKVTDDFIKTLEKLKSLIDNDEKDKLIKKLKKAKEKRIEFDKVKN